MFSWSVLIYIVEWLVRLTMLFVVPHRRQPSSAMAWLLIIFFSPTIGVLLYILFGNYRLPKRRMRRHARLMRMVMRLREQFKATQPDILFPVLTPAHRATVELAERLGQLPILGGNAVELIEDTQTLFDRVVADIDAAKNHVHLLFYIYADDVTGRRVGEALIRAASRGVKCRVLVDSVGARPMLKTLGVHLAQHDVEVCEALPVGMFRRSMSRVDLRNHRKLLIIDGRIAYTGSHNCVDASYGRKDMVWRDLTVRVMGPVVLDMQVVFVGDWYFETGELLTRRHYAPTPDAVGEVAAQVLPSGPNYPTENYQRFLVAALYGAQRHVVMTTPYFVPDAPLMQAIETAVLRGVTVDLIVPQRFDQIMVGAATRAYFEDVLAAGVHLHLYTDGLLHAKTVSIDDEVSFIGSSNFDIRSFALNFEMNMLFYDVAVAQTLRQYQRQYLQHSLPLTETQWAERPLIRQWFENLTKLLSAVL